MAHLGAEGGGHMRLCHQEEEEDQRQTTSLMHRSPSHVGGIIQGGPQRRLTEDATALRRHSMLESGHFQIQHQYPLVLHYVKEERVEDMMNQLIQIRFDVVNQDIDLCQSTLLCGYRMDVT